MRKDGSRVIVSLSISPVRGRRGNIVAASVIARDITERHRYERRLRYLADHDQLTGLLNRRRFEEDLKRELARVGRYRSRGALLSIDLDNFKPINDYAGHAAGDAVLVEIAQALRQRLRTTDVIGRLGGDEFGVVLLGVRPDEARRTAEDLSDAIETARPAFGGKVMRVGASVGVAPFEADDATAAELLVHADLAMYAAKTSGGHGVVLYAPEEARQARMMMRQSWSDRIRAALKNDGFVLIAQPILDLNTGRYVWTLPSDNVPYQFHVKVEAVDRATNIGDAVTAELVKVDLATPKVRILNVEPSK